MNIVRKQGDGSAGAQAGTGAPSQTFVEASLERAVREALDAGLFKEFCRLYGYRPLKGGIERMIDEATGQEEQVHREFVRFVRKCVWEPWLLKMQSGSRPALCCPPCAHPRSGNEEKG